MDAISSFRESPPFEIAQPLRLRHRAPCSCLAAIVPESEAQKAVNELREELSVHSLGSVRQVDVSRLTFAELLEALRQPEKDVLLLAGFEHWPPELWESIDVNRSALLRQGSIVVCLIEQAIEEPGPACAEHSQLVGQQYLPTGAG